MDTTTKPVFRLSFSQVLPNHQLSWDSTSLGALKRCPRYYEYNIIEGYVTRGENTHLRWGSEYNNAQVIYNKAKATGKTHEEAMLIGLRYAMVHTWDEVLNRPWTSDMPEKTRETLIRSLIWYWTKFEEDPLETVTLATGEAAVELPFRIDIDMTSDLTGESYLLCGYLDRKVDFAGGGWITDWKAQPKYSKILTDKGWSTIGELSIGDTIATAEGEFAQVKALHPKGITPVYEVTFQDGTSARCAEEHLWKIANDGVYNWRVVSLKTLLGLVQSGGRYHIPISNLINHSPKSFLLNPYVLGCLLGNGYLGGSSVIFSTSNIDLAETIIGRLQNGDIVRKCPSNNLSWSITGGATLGALRKLNLWGKLAREKFIPQEYMFGSVLQRKELLGGLLDTDGSWDGIYRRYQTTSKRLAWDVSSLIRSLGGYAHITSTRDSSCRTGVVYRVTIRMIGTPLGIKKRYIREISRVEDAETICIEVDTPSGLYVTDNYVVTHNSSRYALDEKYFARYSPDNQVSQYSFAGNIIGHEAIKGVIIDAVQLGVTFSRFQRAQIGRTPAQLEEWLNDSLYYIKLNEGYVKANYWPMNDTSCEKYGGCPYRGICSVSPEVRPKLLEGLFQKRSWDPLVVREI